MAEEALVSAWQPTIKKLSCTSHYRISKSKHSKVEAREERFVHSEVSPDWDVWLKANDRSIKALPEMQQ